MNRLDTIRATRVETHRAPTYVKRPDRTSDWDDCVSVRVCDFDMLMAVAMAAAAYAAAREEAYRIGGDYGDIINTPTADRARLGMSEEGAIDALHKATGVMDDAEEALHDAVASLLEDAND